VSHAPFSGDPSPFHWHRPQCSTSSEVAQFDRLHNTIWTYLTYALSLPVEHRPQTTFLHPVLSWATAASIFHSCTWILLSLFLIPDLFKYSVVALFFRVLVVSTSKLFSNAIVISSLSSLYRVKKSFLAAATLTFREEGQRMIVQNRPFHFCILRPTVCVVVLIFWRRARWRRMRSQIWDWAANAVPRLYHIHRRSRAKTVAASGHVEVKNCNKNLGEAYSAPQTP